MIDSLWRTIGFGEPITLKQMLGRAGSSFICAVVVLATDLAGTFGGWLAVLFFGISCGMYLMKVGMILQQVVDAMDAEANPTNAVETELILDSERDYVVNPGEPCWITVGNYSIRVKQLDSGSAEVLTYHLYREDEDPIARIEV